MTLKELQGMIKEEFDALQNEAEDVDVSVSDADVDATEGDDSEDILRQIFDMLKGKFDGEEEAGDDMDDEDEDMMGEVKHDDKKDEAADMEEAASQGFGDSGNKKTSGANVGFTPAKTTRGDGKLHEGVKRFQKLANIIK